MMRGATTWGLIAVTLVFITAGCRTSPRHAAPLPMPSGLPTDDGLDSATYADALAATVSPPEGWKPDVLKESGRHKHRVWLSPTGRTAYGVIHFSLPLPVGHDPVLWYFLREMKRSEGEAELLSKQWDPNLRAVRFVAQGGLYTIRTNLLVRGFNGWAVYAGTLTSDPIAIDELELAERAREHTIVGRLAGDQAGR
jgi:hypothetical protein